MTSKDIHPGQLSLFPKKKLPCVGFEPMTLRVLGEHVHVLASVSGAPQSLRKKKCLSGLRSSTIYMYIVMKVCEYTCSSRIHSWYIALAPLHMHTKICHRTGSLPRCEMLRKSITVSLHNTTVLPVAHACRGEYCTFTTPCFETKIGCLQACTC